MRPSTILLASLTVVFGAATVVLAVLVAPGDGRGLAEVLRLGGIVTVAFGAICAIDVANHRRRERLQGDTEAHPGAVFVDARATSTTVAELAAWSPETSVPFPCDLGFDHDGVTARSGRERRDVGRIASREEVVGLDVFSQLVGMAGTYRWGLVLHLAPRSAGPGSVHLWVLDGGPNQDEYAMRQTVSRIQAALGR